MLQGLGLVLLQAQTTACSYIHGHIQHKIHRNTLWYAKYVRGMVYQDYEPRGWHEPGLYDYAEM